MKGLAVRETKLSEVFAHPETRAEAEFYLAPNGVQKNFVLGETAVPFAQYGTSDELNEDGIGFPILRLNEISNGFIEEVEKHCALLTAGKFEALKLKKGDVLVCRTNGNPRLVGKSGLVMEDAAVAFASYLFRARPNPAIISPATLMVFLNSRNGRLEIEKHSIRSNQVNFSPERLRQARIPLFSEGFRNQIDSKVDNAYLQRRMTDTAYIEADKTLLRALKLENWQPPEPLTYIRRASDALAMNRLDAEHFQPKYMAMLERIQKHALHCRHVEEFSAHCDRGQQPEYVEDGTLAVINSRHILECGLDYDNFESTGAQYWNELKFKSARIFRNDILTYTTGANVGRTAAYLNDERALASNHVNLLRVNEVNPIYVATVMNSMIGRWQTQMLVTGSAQAELYPDDILRFLIPFVEKKTEATIIAAVERAHAARQRAHELLAAAQHAVEIAIEDSEAAALAHLKTHGV